MIVNTALEMPLAKFAAIRIRETNKAAVSESSFTGSVQIQSFDAEYWSATLQFPKLERVDGELVSAFLSLGCHPEVHPSLVPSPRDPGRPLREITVPGDHRAGNHRGGLLARSGCDAGPRAGPRA